MKGNNSIISVCILQHLVIDDFKVGDDIMGTQGIVCNFNIKNIFEFLCFCKLVQVDSRLYPLFRNTFDILTILLLILNVTCNNSCVLYKRVLFLLLRSREVLSVPIV